MAGGRRISCNCEARGKKKALILLSGGWVGEKGEREIDTK
jgi:hypothetical protein